MRPTDKTRNQDLPRGQGDHSTLYVSLELSRSTWLVLALSPNSDKMSKQTIAVGDAPKLLALLARLRRRAEQLVGGSLNVAVIQEAASMASGYIDRSRQMTLKTMSSILHRSPCRDGGGARRRTRSMAKRC
jgi:hypothetical protein